MKVTPKSEEDFKSRELVPGDYQFLVTGSTEKISQNGNEMIEIILRVTDINGRYHTIFDYLLDKEPFDYKLRHICDCAGILHKYNNGEINSSDLLNKRGMVKLVLRKNKDGIEKRISVDDYIVDKNINNNTPFDENLPF